MFCRDSSVALRRSAAIASEAVQLLHLPAVPEGRVRSWPSFRLAPGRTEGRSPSRSSSRVHVPSGLTLTGCPVVTDGLDGDLARLQEWPRREDGPVRVRATGLRRSAGAAGARGLRTGGRRRGYRTKASGRRVVRRCSRGRVAPAFSWHASDLPPLPRARSRAARRAACSARP
jgi:hypothetical protein